MSARIVEMLYEVWEVTQWKDGCVYRTRNTGKTEWRERSQPRTEGNLQYVSMSSDFEGTTIRSRVVGS